MPTETHDLTTLRKGSKDPWRGRPIVVCPTCGRKGGYEPSKAPQDTRARGGRLMGDVVHTEDVLWIGATSPREQHRLTIEQENQVRAGLGLGPVELYEAEQGRHRFYWAGGEFQTLKKLDPTRPILPSLWSEAEAGQLLAVPLLRAFKAARGSNREHLRGIAQAMCEAFGPEFTTRHGGPYHPRG